MYYCIAFKQAIKLGISKMWVQFSLTRGKENILKIKYAKNIHVHLLYQNNIFMIF